MLDEETYQLEANLQTLIKGTFLVAKVEVVEPCALRVMLVVTSLSV
jgi:hypothetical protein